MTEIVIWGKWAVWEGRGPFGVLHAEATNVWYTMHRRQLRDRRCMWQKVGGLRSLKALEFEKWGAGLEPISLTEVYAYDHLWQYHNNTVQYTIQNKEHIFI